MPTLKNKVSLQVEQQLPEFVRSENPNFVAFMKAYYEFMESAELKLTSFGSVDSMMLEAQPVDGSTTNYVLLESTNRYRSDEIDTILQEETTYGAFVNGETITGDTSKATAVIRTADINVGSRLFISSQNDFLIGEVITGGTSNATAVISNYTANPVQNVQQLMQYADIDDTIDQFFDQFKEAFLRTIPKDLTSGVNERSLLKNIKDLYRAKGTKKGHELFFRILLNEEVEVAYPNVDMLRVSDGDWSEDTILRVTSGDDTILMENANDVLDDIFILLEDGAQLKIEDSIVGSSDLLKLVGQVITQGAVSDQSILPGGAYYGEGFEIISQATALIDSVLAYNFGGETVYQLTLSQDSLVGTFVTGQRITATSNDDFDATLYGKIISQVTGYNALTSTSSQYYQINDPLTVTADNGSDAALQIETLTAGTVSDVIVDSAGSGYLIGDVVTVNNANTNGTALEAKVTVVNGGIAPEAGNILGVVNIGGEFGVIQYPNGDFSDEGIVYNERIGQEWGTIYEQNPSGTPWPPLASDIILEDGFYFLGEDEKGFDSIITESSATAASWSTREHIISETYVPEMIAEDHITLQPYTVFADGGVIGDLIVQDSGGGTGDVTDVRISSEGWGYTSTPLLTLPASSLTVNDDFRINLETASGTGEIITEDGFFYMAQEAYNPGTFTIGETIAGGTSSASATVVTNSPTTEVVFTIISGAFQAEETITGGTSLYTANVGSIAGATRTGGTIYAKGTGVGGIKDILIVDSGAHYTDTVTVGAFTNFLCTDISGIFTVGETVTGGTSSATGVYEETDTERNIIKLSGVTGTFVGGDNKSGETITGGSSGETAIIDSYDSVALVANQGTIGTTSGRFLTEAGFIDEKTKKIQDSYYWQDFSYVVKTATSINQWRNQLIASVHPAGWQVFGQVDIATAVQSLANITSTTGLGPIYEYIWNTLIGRRLGTTDQGTLSPTPALGVNDPSTPTPALEVLGSGRFTLGDTITGSSSGATGLVVKDVDVGVNRLVYFTPSTGIFTSADTITNNGTSATVYKIFGLLGQRDITLTHWIQIDRIPEYMVGTKYGFAPAYRDLNSFKWRPSQVATATSSRTFNSMAVYPVYLNMVTTITSAISNSVTTIPVGATDNLPTIGTIKLENEEITYTGRSTATGAGNLTGATRAANGTTAATHASGTNLTHVKNGAKAPWRIVDWTTFHDGVTPNFVNVMLGFDNNITSWVGSPKNNRCIDAEITVGKT